MTRDQIADALAAIQNATDRRLLIMRTIIAPDGSVVATFKRTVLVHEDAND